MDDVRDSLKKETAVLLLIVMKEQVTHCNSVAIIHVFLIVFGYQRTFMAKRDKLRYALVCWLWSFRGIS